NVLFLSRSHAYSLIDSAQVMHDLSSIEDKPLPTNEAQARELRRWKSPQDRVAKWEMVLEKLKKQPLTAKSIREVLRPGKVVKEIPSDPALSEESITRQDKM